MRMTTARVLGRLVVALMAATMIAGPVQAAPGGNGGFAKACKNDGYLAWERVDGTDFAGTSECIAYGKAQGQLYPWSTLTVHVAPGTGDLEGLIVVEVFGDGLATGSSMVVAYLDPLGTPYFTHTLLISEAGSHFLHDEQNCTYPNQGSAVRAQVTTSDFRSLSQVVAMPC